MPVLARRARRRRPSPVGLDAGEQLVDQPVARAGRAARRRRLEVGLGQLAGLEAHEQLARLGSVRNSCLTWSGSRPSPRQNASKESNTLVVSTPPKSTSSPRTPGQLHRHAADLVVQLADPLHEVPAMLSARSG